MTTTAYLCDGIRTAIGRYGGALATVRTDDLAAAPLTALKNRLPHLDWQAVDDILFGCANQAGEDNRNVARMAALLAELPADVAAVTINRLCGSGMDAVAQAMRTIWCGEAALVVAGGVESMSRAPLVMPKAATAFSRQTALYDSTIGWRFVNPVIERLYGIDSMGETAENVAIEYHINRADQDAFALRSQQRAAAAIDRGWFADEITPIVLPQRKGDAVVIDSDEHPRPDTTFDKLAALSPAFHRDGTVTAGNAAGINDGACALVIATEDAVSRHQLTPRARLLGCAVAGVAPRIMGIGPIPAITKLLTRLNMHCDDFGVIELNEAFAAQALAVLRHFNIADDDPRVNANGGAIALGHPLGMSGARLVLTAARRLHDENADYALCTMCIGVGQGIALALARR